MNDVQVKAALWLFSEMKKRPSVGFYAYDMLDKPYGASDDDAHVVIGVLMHLNIIEKHDKAIYCLTNKALSIDDLYAYINREKIKEQGEISAARKSDYDWRHRWYAHPVVTAISGFILGILGTLLTDFILK